MKTIFDEKTLVPVSLIIVLIGGVMWLTTIWATTNDNANDIKDLKEFRSSDAKDIQQKLDKIREDVSYIKGLLKEKL